MVGPRSPRQGARNRLRRASAGLALTLIAGAGLAKTSANNRLGDQIFSDEVLVKEVAVIVNSRGVMSKRSEASMSPDEFVVTEDGTQRRATKLVPVSDLPRRPPGVSADSEEAGPWNIVIYVDRQLSTPSQAVASLLAIAKRTFELKELGAVTIAVADPDPRVVLSKSQAPRHVAKILLDLAKIERDERNRPSDRPTSEDSHPTVETIRRQWDWLVNFLSDTSYDGPRALFLVSDGFLLSPRDLQVLSGRGGSDAHSDVTPDLATVVMDTAQALSSYGWLTVPVSLGRPRPEERQPAADEFDEWRDLTQGRDLPRESRTTVNFFGTAKAGKRAAALDDRLYEAYSLPRLAPLRALSEATAGTLAWHDGQLETAVKQLAEHWQLSYQTPDPHDGRIRRVEIMHGGTSKHFKTPWWMRSSTPHMVVEARLRLLLQGEAPGGARLPLRAELVPEGVATGHAPTGMLRLQIEPVELADDIDVGHFRLSVGQAGGAATMTLQHLMDFDAPPLGGAWEYLLPVKLQPNADRLAVVVEDLSRELWGTVTLELPGGDESSRQSNDTGR